jgi:hypothetical protein
MAFAPERVHIALETPCASCFGPAGSVEARDHLEPMCVLREYFSQAAWALPICYICVVAPNILGAYVQRKVNSLSSFYIGGQVESPGLRLYTRNFDHPIGVKAHVFMS